MEDLLDILRSVAGLKQDLDLVRQRHFEELEQLFYGSGPAATVAKPVETAAPASINSSITPQQTKKRPKRLTALTEDEGDSADDTGDASHVLVPRMSNSQLLAVAQEAEDEEEKENEKEANTTGNLMPPPPVPAPVAADISISSGRPQRAAKLKSERNLKEPSLISKLRRPSQNEEVKVKLENEQRASQMHLAKASGLDKPEVAAKPVEKPTVTANPPVADKVPSVAEKNLTVADTNPGEQLNRSHSNLRIKIKREKMSLDASASASETTVTATATTATLEATKAMSDETAVLSTTTAVLSTTTAVLSTTTSASNTTAGSNTTSVGNTTAAKKTRRKKYESHKPIKVERFSDLDKINSPVASRTRGGSNVGRTSQESQAPPQRSIYEDAIESVPSAAPAAAVAASAAANETVTLATGISEATFNIPAGNSTMTLGPCNATFQVDAGAGEDDKENSMETAREGSMPSAGRQSSLMTEDNSPLQDKAQPQPSKYPLPAAPATFKGAKMPSRTHELFNPLVQSPVKMRVEAFENAANAQSNLRPKRIKEVAGTGSSTTPLIGKLPAPTLGRFLTPTQNSAAVALNSAVAKKAPMSACKASTLIKSASATTLPRTNSTKTLSRENSAEDFRKGLHLLADEKKKQREQKHLLAAQQREAKERERAERMAKLAKEREEKRIKKQQEKEKLEERKRAEIEELQRKLYQQEEAERLKKAKAKEQERELLQKMKLQQQLNAKAKKMMPPPPKSKYTFEMLHEDDSTDDEGKVSHKRPPVPSWSRSDVRVAMIEMQSHCPTDVIDSFFSVAPTTPDLKQIFPNIHPNQLKRNSSVLWSTPPRYSELPKY
ncbi:hypothetical protein KR222_009832 [Zaprionus bogoriensis]|nr:hypothetical protein KR222_009832 [Zaprionus bogoriensis]